MPHQCLKCGKIYEDSKYVMEGCPNCGGKSFYYTKKPLDDEKRKKILEEIEEEKIRKIDEIFDEIKKRREEVIKEIKRMKEKVESINVKQMGEYEINVGKLVEEGIIIVYKEGAYHIYLPSLFKWKK